MAQVTFAEKRVEKAEKRLGDLIRQSAPAARIAAVRQALAKVRPSSSSSPVVLDWAPPPARPPAADLARV